MSWRNDPYAFEVTNSVGNSVVVDPSFPWRDDAFRMPTWDDVVIYEMHAGTFNDEPGGGPGDFRTIVERLAHLTRRLGVSVAKVLPAAEFPTGFSMGYNPAHLFAVESEYGGLRAFQEFVQAAHDGGLGVFLDVVYNHFGPDDLDLRRFDLWHQRSHPDGVYFYDRGRIGTPWGPRPDYGRREVRDFVSDNVHHWLGDCRVDGLRLDATAYMHAAGPLGRPIADGWNLLRRLNDEVDARYPWKMVIAEDLQGNPAVTRPTGHGGAGCDAQWDARFVHPVRGVLETPHDGDRDLDAIVGALVAADDGDPFRRVIYTESHDEVSVKNGKRRVPDAIWPGNATGWHARKRALLGSALVLTAPGIPMIFQGQEFLEHEAWHDDRPMNWRRLEGRPGPVAFHSDLIALRRNRFGTTRGLRGRHVNPFHTNRGDKVIAFHRWHGGGPGDDVVVVLNFSQRLFPRYELGMPRAGRWRVRFNGDFSGYGDGFGAVSVLDTVARGPGRDGMPAACSLAVPPYGATVLSQDA